MNIRTGSFIITRYPRQAMKSLRYLVSGVSTRLGKLLAVHMTLLFLQLEHLKFFPICPVYE